MYNKEVIAKYEKFLDNEQFEVVVLEDNTSSDDVYYNVHVISERFKNDELNTLKLQEPKSYIGNPTEYFNKARLIGYLMDHFIWDRFYDEGIFSGYVHAEFE